MKNDKKIVYIIYPDAMKEPSSDLLAMVELIINGIVESRNDIIKISINNEAKLVECNDSNLKNIISILLKANKLEGVKKNLWTFLHKDAENSKNCGLLHCYVTNIKIKYTIKEVKSSPDFSWTIQKNNN